MCKYILQFYFEHGGYCLWEISDNAGKDYGCALKNDMIPISESLINELDSMNDEYATYLDWDEPQNPPLWTEEHKVDFLNRANIVYEKLKRELGSDYEIINDVEDSVT